MNMSFDEVLTRIKEADMVLVGLGEAFDDTSFMKNDEKYLKGRMLLEADGQLWLIPAYDEWFRRNNPARATVIQEALQNLADALQGKNYFVVSASVNDMIDDIAWREGRLVRPCGGGGKKQCPDCCGESLSELTENEKAELAAYFQMLVDSEETESEKQMDNCQRYAGMVNLQLCPKCGKPFVLNNIYTEKYDESGYLSQWQIYTKWLAGTLNRKIVILELGVGMKFPSVIRWPFEKIAFFNQKAEFYRVNGNLYQMSEELKEKGVSIAKNAIDWLRGM